MKKLTSWRFDVDKKLLEMGEYAELSPMMTNWWEDKPHQVLRELYKFYQLKSDISYAIETNDTEMLEELNKKIKSEFYTEDLF